VKNLATFRDARSLIAGLLIGLSIVVPIFAMTGADDGDRGTAWIVVAPIVLALGVVSQVVVTTRPRQRRTNDPDANIVGKLDVRTRGRAVPWYRSRPA
jgi:Na+/melibiose symporter-like transporter